MGSTRSCAVEQVWGGSPHLGPPDLVVPAIHLQLPQQGSDGLPAGLDIPGQQHLELLCEVLARGRKDNVSTSAAAATSCAHVQGQPGHFLVCAAKRPRAVGTAGVNLGPATLRPTLLPNLLSEAQTWFSFC